MMVQILKLSEKTLVTLMIRQKMETFDEKALDHSVDPKLNDDQTLPVHNNVNDLRIVSHRIQSIIGSDHVSLGSPSTSVSIGEIEQQHVDNLSFSDFRKKIGKAFSNYFNENIKFNAVDQVWKIILSFESAKINYLTV